MESTQELGHLSAMVSPLDIDAYPGTMHVLEDKTTKARIFGPAQFA